MSKGNDALIPQGLLIYRAKRHEFPFRLNESIGVLLCYSSKSTVAKEIVLSGCSFPPQPSNPYAAFLVVDGGTRATFDIAIGKKQYTIMSNGHTSLKDLKAKFLICARLPRPFRYNMGCKVGRFVCKAAAAPFKFTDGVCSKLEVFGDKVKQTPDVLFRSPKKENKERFVPENIATGLAAGTGLMIYGFFGGLIGLISEPVKNMKKKGIKGVPGGLGKGMIGLVCKPVGGTIDFVTCAIRGVNNMPRSLYRQLVKLRHRRSNSPEKPPIEEEKVEQISLPMIPILIEDQSPPTSNPPVFEVEEQNDSQLRIELEVLNQRKSQLRESLQALLQTSPELVGHRSCDIDDRSSSFATARNDEDELTESRFYRKFHSELEIKSSRKQVGRITNVLEQYSAQKTKQEISEDSAEMEDAEDAEVLSPEMLPDRAQLCAEPFLAQARDWTPLDKTDDFRPPEAASKGGTALLDKSVQSRLRSTGKEMLKTLGKKILKGDFDLTTISFPIKCMSANTALHNSLKAAMMNPLYITRAALLTDPLERMKLVIVATLSSFSHTSTFLKPVKIELVESCHRRDTQRSVGRRNEAVCGTNESPSSGDTYPCPGTAGDV